jgi:hypothetical protein
VANAAAKKAVNRIIVLLIPGGEFRPVIFVNDPNREMDSHTALHWVHVLVLGPLLVAIGLGYGAGYPAVVLGLGVFMTLYHLYRGFAKWTSGAGGLWVNAIHALAIGPALIAEGSLTAPPRWIRELLLMFGFAGIGYHAYYIINPY